MIVGSEEWQDFMIWLGQISLYMELRYDINLIESFAEEPESSRFDVGEFLYGAFSRKEDPVDFCDNLVTAVLQDVPKFSKN
jgi:hypothetical protein